VNHAGSAVDERTLRAAIELASRAPSVHNTQPWRWVVGPHSVHLYADLGLANAIPERRTDRRRYGAWEVPTAFVDELVARAAEQGAVLRPVPDGHPRRVLLGAIREAAEAQEKDPRYRTETAAWTGLAVDGVGIPPRSLLRDPASGGATARRFTSGTLRQGPGGNDDGGDNDSDEDGALLLVLGTASDDTLSQLRAGEAASAVMLHATRLGLATCPLSQPLEVGQTRLVIRDRVLGGTLSPQLVLRVGWAPRGEPLRTTPRRAVDDTVERMPR
jgi:nitroreductase